MIKEQLEKDLKTALLAGDKDKATTLRGLKSAILYEEVAQKVRDTGLDDDAIAAIFQREAKKRQESADLYVQGGNQERADAELAEKKIIEGYLPEQLNESAIKDLIEAVIGEVGDSSMQSMGKIIGGVKTKAGAAADGATVAHLVKERLTQ